MDQPSLFDVSPGSTSSTHVHFFPRFEDWLNEALPIANKGRMPDSVVWQPRPCGPPPTPPPTCRVPHSEFVRLGRLAAQHRSSDRWALLYAVLWRLEHGEPWLMEMSADPHVAKLRRLAKAVSRDCHKMKAFLRFREVDGTDGEASRFVAWFEPDHTIVELTARFFRDRFTNMCWSILTPDLCAHWEGEGTVWFSSGAQKSDGPDTDRFEDAWRIYYANIFNPARLKTKAMHAEMPQKYWKNLPEATEIPQLIRDSRRRAATMVANPQSTEQLRCGPRPMSPAGILARQIESSPTRSLNRLQAEVKACSHCELAQHATQAVMGEGNPDARVMLLGEQPGDAEDIAGKPFCGPAGELLNEALTAAGIDRQSVYVTNVVKHFHYLPRGKRRLHQRPTIEHVAACAGWLEQEIQLLQPRIVVCLGETAAQSQLSGAINMSRDRGKRVQLSDRDVLITYHPSYILRASTGRRREDLFRLLVGDLSNIPAVLNNAP